MISTAPDRPRFRAPVLFAVAVTLGMVGCQPADDSTVLEGPDETGQEVADRPAVPATLEETIAETDVVAAEWQEDTRAVEVLIHLTPHGEPARARVTYLAAEADRFLTVEIGRDGPSQERPTLATLGLAAIDGDGLDAIPLPPPDAQEAQALAEAAAPVLEACGFDTAVDTVLYASGAPAAWDGQRWVDELEWTVTARSLTGSAVALDPVEATPVEDPCVSPPQGT